jgi:hypothetical protein
MVDINKQQVQFKQIVVSETEAQNIELDADYQFGDDALDLKQRTQRPGIRHIQRRRRTSIQSKSKDILGKRRQDNGEFENYVRSADSQTISSQVVSRQHEGQS